METFNRTLEIERDSKLSDRRRVRARITSGRVDRHGDVVNPAGGHLDDWFATGAPVIRDHDATRPVAAAVPETVTRGADGISLEVQFPPEGVSAASDETLGLIRSGVLNSWSIGASSQETQPLPGGGVEYVRWSLNELSVVAVPANVDAVTLAKSATEPTKEAAMRELKAAPAVQTCKNAINRCYSLADAMSQVVDGTLSGIVREVHDELERHAATPARGHRIPWGAIAGIQKAGTITDPALGGNLTHTDKLDVLWTDPAAVNEILGMDQFGVETITSMESSVEVPKLLTNTTSSWVAMDADAPTNTDPTYGTQTVGPKTISALTVTKRSMFRFKTYGTGGNYETFMRRLMGDALMRDASADLMFADGTLEKPLGLLDEASITMTDKAAAAIGPAELLALKNGVMRTWKDNQVGEAEDRYRYVCHPQVFDSSRFWSWKSSATDTPWLQTDLNTANGRAWWGVRTLTSGYSPFVPDATATPDQGSIYCGRFGEAISVAFGGGVDVIADPYSMAESGSLRLVMFADLNAVWVPDATDCAHGFQNVDVDFQT